jgi:hypothetical protein
MGIGMNKLLSVLSDRGDIFMSYDIRRLSKEEARDLREKFATKNDTNLNIVVEGLQNNGLATMDEELAVDVITELITLGIDFAHEEEDEVHKILIK